MDDVVARRQHDVRRRAAILADQLEGAGLVGLVGEHPPHQAAGDDWACPCRSARSATARPAPRSSAPGGGTTGGTGAIDGWAEARGCVNGAGRLGHGGRAGRRRQAHRRRRASGTDAGGTGGGRSVNIWAETAAGQAENSADSKRKRDRQQPAAAARNLIDAVTPGESWRHAFHRKRGKFKPSGQPRRPIPRRNPATRPDHSGVAIPSHSLPSQSGIAA